jgi:hypothetical protein
MAKIQTSTDITFLCPVPRGNPHTQYQYLCKEKNDIFVKSEKFTRNVIPARHPGENRGGIQKYQGVKKALDPGFHRCDDSSRVSQKMHPDQIWP